MNDLLWNIKTFDQLSTKQLYLILKVRQEVFIVEQTCFYLDADGYDEKAIHIWAEKNGDILAYCRVFAPGVKYSEASIGRVLTHPNYRNLKLGKILMQMALKTIEARFRTHHVRISAQDYLHRFYTELGFKSTGKCYLEDDIPHTEMLK